MPPEWTDIRAFLWRGWRSHVRYTYRGYLPNGPNVYDKRVRVRPCEIARTVITQLGEWPRYPQWRVTEVSTQDSRIAVVEDNKFRYLWQANEGGTWHTELIDDMLRYSHEHWLWGRADLVGCNSPQRALFKRGFGLPLVPYHYVTTGDPSNVLEFWGDRRPLDRAA